jgi:hypothetical protein
MKAIGRNLILFAAVGVLMTPGLRGSELDKKTIVTFDQAVEIPGAVLPPGEYVIKRLDPSNPDVIRFMSSDETHVFATVKGLPTQRLEPAEKVEIAFEERTSSTPQAVKKWFYPGDLTGTEFVYPERPQRKEMLLASNTAPHIGTESAYTSIETGKPVAMKSTASESSAQREQSSQSVEIAQATTPGAPELAQAQPATQSQPAQSDPQAASELPRTASNRPLAASLGALSILVGAFLRKFTRKLATNS